MHLSPTSKLRYLSFNDRLSALELALTPDMGHAGWANDIMLSNIH